MFMSTSTHTDADECALGISGCNQICTNTIGSYVCSCYFGYQISLNNKTCVGKHIASIIICSNMYRIISIGSCQLPNTQIQMNVLLI